jgi:hypothetical protein
MAWDRGPDKEREPKESLVISRHWGNPEIKITVNQEKIELLTNIKDFTDALIAEIGNPLMILTRAQLKQRIENAAHVVIEKIKEASAQVM